MMSHPSLAEYMDALRLDLGGVLSDPLLARGRLLMRGPGLPVVLSGNFALTFLVQADSRKYAVRCFHKPMDDLQERYEAISRCLTAISSPYFVDFTFQPAGIRTESGTYPVVRMDWVEGQTLGAFVAEHRKDASTLQVLRDSLRRLAANLSVCGIAHGDIQPSNIIVESPARLRLIDYDGMFVPQLRSLSSAEIGQRNFQHPGRLACHFDEHLDTFAFVALDLALEALARQPDLWEATDSGEDAIVFRAQDYADPARSPAFRAVAQLPRLAQRVRDFAAVCLSPFEQIPRLTDLLAGRNIPEVSVVFSGGPILPTRRRYLPTHAVIDATSFARCCNHVGDRVELVGKVLRVARSHTPRFESTYLRVEFGERGHDMACLRIWPEAESHLADVPDASWVGQWVSAVGLLEPVARGHSGSQRQRDVSMSITSRSQLQRITAEEGLRRLRGHRGQTRPAPDAACGVRTDPVLTDRPPRVPADRTRRPHGGTRPALARTRRATRPPATTQLEGRSDPQAPPISAEVTPILAPTAPVAPNSPPLAPPEPAAPATVATPPTPGASSADVHRSSLARGPAPPELVAARASGRRPLALAAAVAIAALIAAWFFTTRAIREDDQPLESVARAKPAAPDNTRAAAAPKVTPAAPQAPVESKLVSQATLRRVGLPIETLAGSLSIGADLGEPGTDGPKKIVLIDSRPLARLRDDNIVLAHRSVYSDSEIVVGFTECDGTAPPCGLRRPFWILLQQGKPPVVREAPSVWASSAAGAVTAFDGGVRVDLGTWNGERRSVTVTTTGAVDPSRQRAPIVPLNGAECALVTKALEDCAESVRCASFAASAERIPRHTRSRLNRTYHERTGLDAAAFRSLCTRSCELGLTPSDDFVRRNACSGAARGQWNADDPTAGLLPE